MKFLPQLLLSVLGIFIGFFLMSFLGDKQRNKQAEKEIVRETVENKSEASNIQYVKIAGANIKVEIPEDKSLGLSGRNGLQEDEGMLFIFDLPGKHSFWMKDMNFPIDIIWLAEDLRVVYIKKDARPELYPKSFGSDQNSKYVLEVVSGFSDKNNLKVGDRVEFIF